MRDPSRGQPPPPLAPALPALLLLDGSLGGRHRLEPLVGDRLSAVHRQSVRAFGEPGLRSLERGELLAKVLVTAFVKLVLVEVLGPLVAGLDLLVALQRTFGVRGQRLLDACSLPGE